MGVFNWLRVRWKLWLRKRRPIPSFCKHCGRDVHDFHVPDDVWKVIEPYIRDGYTLCYDCFCESCIELGLPATWFLSAE